MEIHVVISRTKEKKIIIYTVHNTQQERGRERERQTERERERQREREREREREKREKRYAVFSIIDYKHVLLEMILHYLQFLM